ncbi:AmmeMemoRadiSam system radical SAM enzyme [Pseudodesulfovibrio indicus]|jgi:pyruvate formate lyase activating enzyme|uniref:Pyruvate formate lyase activating enzyme n=1 Tax=Pseudodesulfovibrio indicus TaxID=1716143 RepID=A0A126QLM4_9BACT|nr:AmmeMemoRadiSam system radical SAM enzyme [Pseudodesulfovibrio indicus]AMK10696.1 radical SAM protein [Pseudodesulfovibrio indicus]TDT91677.1 pyruvate formate lyase activating enzyme [Pseudodesulfovibrio indicus]
MIEARLWKPLKDGAVQCRLCNHFCAVKPGARGKCGVRENREGTLWSLNYDKVAAVNLDPVEKKPLYHFLPGTRTFSFATMGCNLSCTFCQNWSLSQPPRTDGTIRGQRTSPEELVDEAVRRGAASISYTYSEPTIFFELMQDTARLARVAGLKNIMVSNGFMSPECLEALGPDIDAINVDLKCYTESFYEEISGARLKPVLDNLRTIKHELKWWLEVTTLLIPGRNDSPEELDRLTDFLATEIGADTPWHISRFHPDYRMTSAPPTSGGSLEAAYAVGKAKGLKYVYIGNMPGSNRQTTLCPGCGREVIDRSGFSANMHGLRHGRCAACGEPVDGVGLA